MRRVEKQCLLCGHTFTSLPSVVFCTTVCADTYRRDQVQRALAGKKPLQADAGLAYEQARRALQQARDNARAAEIMESEATGPVPLPAAIPHPAEPPEDLAEMRRRGIVALDRLKKEKSRAGTYECEVCGWRPPAVVAPGKGESFVRIVHGHHVVPLSCGGSNDSANVVFLCPNHHAVAHYLGSQHARKWYGASTREELIEEVKLAEGDPDAWRLLRVNRLRGSGVGGGGKSRRVDAEVIELGLDSPNQSGGHSTRSKERDQ